MPYVPGKLPQLSTPDGQALGSYFENELQSLAGSLVSNVVSLPVTPIFAPPKKLRTGLIVYADGVKWNPGSGEGLYVYSSIGTWIWLEDNPVVPPTYVPPRQVCRVSRNANQSFISSTRTKIAFDTITFDPQSIWDSTNKRMKPKIAGYYFVYGGAQIAWTASSLIFGLVSVEFNGVLDTDGSLVFQSGSAGNSNVCSLLHFNGSTDFVELFADSNGTSPSVLGSAVNSSMSLTLVSPD